MPAVSCKGLHKRFGRHVALAGLDFEVPRGSLFGLLGPNGAGKSTTLRILAGLVRADAGQAALFGVDVRRHVEATRGTAFLVENASFPAHLTARAVMRRTASYMGVAPDFSLLERVGIEEAAARRVGGFSHGMRQRLGLACALSGAPDLLVLDEPQNGLDPRGLRMLRRILSEEHARGATILVSVHRLAEVEGLCTHAAIVAEGKALRSGSVSELLKEENPRYRLVVDDVARAREVLPQTPVVGENGVLTIEADRDLAARIAKTLIGAGVRVYELAPVRLTLDDVYLNEVGA